MTSPTTKRLGYRPEVDGLRAVAVLAVVFFHLEWRWIQGGYVGVDVFFVISGFLITKKILSDSRKGRFSLREFYLARIRRIIPALLASVFLVLVASSLVLSPRLLVDTAWSALGAIGSVSNILFYQGTDYFDTESELKPLLHTWSLGVEEQYYLFWPAAVVLWLKASSVLVRRVIFVAALLLTTGASEWAVRWEPVGAYFLVPFRVYEFMLGALVIGLENRFPVSKGASVALSLTGLALVFGASLLFDPMTRFPGLMAAIPCVGSVLVIWAGDNALSRALLSNPVSLFIGRISYSLYLVHWPIIVLSRYAQGGELSASSQVVALLSMVALAFAMYRWVETPFRSRAFRARVGVRALAGASVASLLVIAGMSTFAISKDGWVFPGPTMKTLIGDVQERRRQTWRFVKDPGTPAVQRFGNGRYKVLILGDSHSKDLFNALHLNTPKNVEFRRLQLRHLCVVMLKDWEQRVARNKEEQACIDQIRTIARSRLLREASHVVAVSKWDPDMVHSLDLLQAFVEAQGKHFFVVDRKVEFADVPDLLARTGSVRAAQKMLESTRDPEVAETNEVLSELAKEHGFRVFSWHEVACDPECVIATPKELYYLDGHHWSLEGARVFGARLVRKLERAVRQMDR